MEENKVIWPGWEVVRKIGSGSFGAVYEIQRTIRGRTEHAAVKQLTIPQNKSEIAELRADGYDDESITQYFADSLDKIEGEYATLRDDKTNDELFIAMALLPLDVDIGSRLHYEMLEFTLID